jgi:AcrR family transcriptional regulator
MRVKTDARRNAIVASAWEAFRDCGYEGTTMSAINARAGGSKATLYNYFPSKAELFSAALEYGLLETSGESFRHLSGPGNLKERLLRFARAHLAGRMSPDMVAVDRILVMEAFRSDVFEVIRDKSYLKRRMIADRLEPEMAAGRLRDDDPLRAAVHLLALIEADLLERHLHGDRNVTREMIEEQVHTGVEVFLRAYAPDLEA